MAVLNRLFFALVFTLILGCFPAPTHADGCSMQGVAQVRAPESLLRACQRPETVEQQGQRLYDNRQVRALFVLLAAQVNRCENAPACVDAYARRAHFHALTFDYDAALADIDAALRLDDTNADLWLQRGQVNLLLYEWDAVLMDYNRALSIDPYMGNAYYYRGVLYYSLVRREQALADFARYIQLAPDGELVEKAQQYASAITAELDALND